MQWDMFISHASEDKEFARALSESLQKLGLRIWFDEFALSVGDSLRRSIDHGLANSHYGVVILSKHFFEKEWPQKELDALIAREDGRAKVILPVWYRVTRDDVVRYSPLLADRLAIRATDRDQIVNELYRAIRPNRLSMSAGEPCFIRWPDGSKMVVIPARPAGGMALCIGTNPVTNQQYQRFVAETGAAPPSGSSFLRASNTWEGPFSPWSHVDFNRPNQPVVCVSFGEALAYCEWVNRLLGVPDTEYFIRRSETPLSWCGLPTPGLWNLAALGSESTPLNPREWSGPQLHHRASAPIDIDEAGTRANSLGVSDAFGNVWEWCEADSYLAGAGIIALYWERNRVNRASIRGGSFLDDLEKIEPFIPMPLLPESYETRHSDLGFRIAGMLPLGEVPERVVATLEHAPSCSKGTWLHTLFDTYY